MNKQTQKIAYFSYGSNTNESDFYEVTQMEMPKPICHAILPDRELAFTYQSQSRGGGVLDVRPRIGATVIGAVSMIDRELFEVIRRKEGSPYIPREEWAYTDSGNRILVAFFEVREEYRKTFVPPSERYLAIVREGYKKVGLSDWSLDAAAAAKPTWFERPLMTFEPLAIGCKLAAHLPGWREDRSAMLELFGHRYQWRGQTIIRLASRGGNLIAAESGFLMDPTNTLAEIDRAICALPNDSQRSGIFRTPVWAGTVDRGKIRTAWCYVWWGRLPAGAVRLKSEEGLEDNVANLASDLVMRSSLWG
jgi:hypothetical protein